MKSGADESAATPAPIPDVHVETKKVTISGHDVLSYRAKGGEFAGSIQYTVCREGETCPPPTVLHGTQTMIGIDKAGVYQVLSWQCPMVVGPIVKNATEPKCTPIPPPLLIHWTQENSNPTIGALLDAYHKKDEELWTQCVSAFTTLQTIPVGHLNPTQEAARQNILATGVEAYCRAVSVGVLQTLEDLITAASAHPADSNPPAAAAVQNVDGSSDSPGPSGTKIALLVLGAGIAIPSLIALTASLAEYRVKKATYDKIVAILKDPNDLNEAEAAKKAAASQKEVAELERQLAENQRASEGLARDTVQNIEAKGKLDQAILDAANIRSAQAVVEAAERLPGAKRDLASLKGEFAAARRRLADMVDSPSELAFRSQNQKVKELRQQMLEAEAYAALIESPAVKKAKELVDSSAGKQSLNDLLDQSRSLTRASSDLAVQQAKVREKISAIKADVAAHQVNPRQAQKTSAVIDGPVKPEIRRLSILPVIGLLAGGALIAAGAAIQLADGSAVDYAKVLNLHQAQIEVLRLERDYLGYAIAHYNDPEAAQ